MKNNLLRYPVLLLILALAYVHAGAQESQCWNIFRGDQALSGQSELELPENPELLWSYQAGDEFRSSPVSCDNLLVAGSGDGTVHCLDDKGKLQWKFSTDNMIEAPALILQGTVYIGNMDGALYAIDLYTGKEIWKYQTENQISGSPNWWTEGGETYILVGSYDFYLHCVNAKTGKNRWKYESDNFINGAAACSEGKAVFGGCDGFLHIVDINRGELQEKIMVASYVAGSAALKDNFAYIGDYDGRFTCVNMAEKEIVWAWEDVNTRLPFIASPAIYKNSIITGNRDKYVYSFNRSSGELLWKYNTGSRVDASPVVAGDKVLVTNMRGDVIILEAGKGKEVWNYELGSPITGNPALLNGRIIVAASDGYIYCLGEK